MIPRKQYPDPPLMCVCLLLLTSICYHYSYMCMFAAADAINNSYECMFAVADTTANNSNGKYRYHSVE